VIRGVLILGVGFALGYSKAMLDVEEIKDIGRATKSLIESMTAEVDRKADQNNEPVVDDSFVDVDSTRIEDIPTQGET
jgi:hypothetical protein